MRELARGSEQEQGTWYPEGKRGEEHQLFSICIACPKCGKSAALWIERNYKKVGQNHSIAEDGTVSPSVVCPYAPCDFHEFVRLQDYITSGIGELA